MKAINFFLIVVTAITVASCSNANSENQNEKGNVTSREFYQLKTYTFETDEQMKVTEQYLAEAFLPGLRKLNIGPVGVFKFIKNEEDTTKKLMVLIPFTSMEQFLEHETSLAKDEVYTSAGSNYINASYEQPAYQRIESTLLKAFVDWPAMHTPKLDGPRAERVYELRSYESPTEKYYWNKVDMFNAGGEVELFNKLEFNAVFYGEVISGSKMPNLMYMTTFENQESRDTHWDAFREAPEWLKLKVMPEYQNNVSHADLIFLYPTEYSDY